MAKWNIDHDHSVAAFSIKHMMIAYVHGQFNNISGTINFDHEKISETSMAFEIIVDSIITGIKKRDDHLKSQDFFCQDKYPKITFASTKAEITGFNSCKISGDLTVRGTTKPVSVDVEFFGSVKSPFGETSMGFTAKTMLAREDFEMSWNQSMENGGYMVGKDVYIFMDIEADLAE